MNKLIQAIEAILFVTPEPVKLAFLANKLEKSEEEISEAVKELAESLNGHGISLVESGEGIALSTHSDHSALIESIKKEDLQKDLSKASSETLSIIAYLGGATRSQLEFIRGVNATYSLRALLMRGLIEQKGAGRAISYEITTELLNHFGVSKVEELPNYTETKDKLLKLLNEQES